MAKATPFIAVNVTHTSQPVIRCTARKAFTLKSQTPGLEVNIQEGDIYYLVASDKVEHLYYVVTANHMNGFTWRGWCPCYVRKCKHTDRVNEHNKLYHATRRATIAVATHSLATKGTLNGTHAFSLMR